MTFWLKNTLKIPGILSGIFFGSLRRIRTVFYKDGILRLSSRRWPEEFIPDRFPGSEIDPGFGDGFILFVRRSQNERYEWKLWMLLMDQNIPASFGSFRLLSIDCILFLFYERSSKFF